MDATSLVIAAVLSVISGIAVRSMLIASMSNVSNAREADAYLVRGSISLTERSDNFLRQNIDRRPKHRK